VSCFHLHTLFFMAGQPYWAKAKASPLLRFCDHTQLYTPHSIRLLQTSVQPLAQTSYLTMHNTHICALWQHSNLHSQQMRGFIPMPEIEHPLGTATFCTHQTKCILLLIITQCISVFIHFL
jgi:hypothetical protein